MVSFLVLWLNPGMVSVFLAFSREPAVLLKKKILVVIASWLQWVGPYVFHIVSSLDSLNI